MHYCECRVFTVVHFNGELRGSNHVKNQSLEICTALSMTVIFEAHACKGLVACASSILQNNL